MELDNPDKTTARDFVSIPYEMPEAGTVSIWINPTDWYDYQTIFDNSVNADDWKCGSMAAACSDSDSR